MLTSRCIIIDGIVMASVCLIQAMVDFDCRRASSMAKRSRKNSFTVRAKFIASACFLYPSNQEL